MVSNNNLQLLISSIIYIVSEIVYKYHLINVSLSPPPFFSFTNIKTKLVHLLNEAKMIIKIKINEFKITLIFIIEQKIDEHPR